MQSYILAALLLIRILPLIAQTRVCDYSARVDWPIINSEHISNDGKFVAYKLTKGKQIPALIIQAIDTSWKIDIPGVIGEPEFTENSRWLLFMHTDDSIGLMDLFNLSVRYINSVGTYSLSKGQDEQWIAYKIALEKNDLALVNLASGEEKLYFNVERFLFSNSGKVLLSQQQSIIDGSPKNVVVWHNLLNGKNINICTCNEPSGFIFDQSGTKLSFFSINNVENRSMVSLRYYEDGMDSAKELITSPVPGFAGMTIIEERPFFSSEGDKLFFFIGKQNSEEHRKPSNNEPEVRVLTQKDDSLKFEERRKNAYLSVIDLRGDRNKIVRLEQINDGLDMPLSSDNQKYVLMSSRNIDASFMDYRWRPTAIPDMYLVSVKDGSRRLLKKRLISACPQFSLTGKYAVWFDQEKKNWYAYDIALSILKNITHAITSPIYNYESNDYPYPAPEGILGWISNDEAVLIYDRKDIWRVDPKGEKPPVNITRGYGQKNNICLRYLDFSGNERIPLKSDDKILLMAFNYSNKRNGFFKMPLNKPGDLELLCMQPRFFYFPDVGDGANVSGESEGFIPSKAKGKNVYLVKRMSANEYPNLYVTTDFKEFIDLTHLQPHREFNWYQSELIHWKNMDGTSAEGIVYKPQNFDPKKKYPVIFYYYEKNADMLNVFIYPELSDGRINIPWFVSKGYIVVMPNIYYEIGDPGKGVYNSLISVANYLSTKPWVDIHHMGLMGHSYGGWETNYMITHTSLFAAAAVCAGVSDIIRFYEDELPGSAYTERGQGRMSKTLWENPKSYFDNSPIYEADRVSTPILIVHNKSDGNVNYLQGLQWYNALTRLGKKAWMLSYEKEGHTIDDEKNQLDFTIRITQFFNYYLKRKQAPLWMIMGGTSLELDSSRSKP